MKFMLDKTEIGQRIEHYRNRKELTQGDLAKLVGVSRTAITQIEQGKRNVSALELHRLSQALHFPIEEIYSDSFSQSAVFETSVPYHTASERVSKPPEEPNYEKFRNVLLYLLEKCAGKPNVGETVLYKLLYFADFNHFEAYEKHLTGAAYRKLPYGPVPLHLDQVLENLVNEGKLQKIKTEYFGYPQTRYLPLEKANLKVLDGAEKETLDQVIEQYSDWSAKAISEFSHKDMPWKATGEGEYIDYELAFYREPPYSAKTYNYDEPEE
jgi:DNA-binding XRE family transcriptional regulator/uncharacterized phage-associated protein